VHSLPVGEIPTGRGFTGGVSPTACEKLKCTRIALLLRANLHEKVELIPADHLKSGAGQPYLV